MTPAPRRDHDRLPRRIRLLLVPQRDIGDGHIERHPKSELVHPRRSRRLIPEKPRPFLLGAVASYPHGCLMKRQL